MFLTILTFSSPGTILDTFHIEHLPAAKPGHSPDILLQLVSRPSGSIKYLMPVLVRKLTTFAFIEGQYLGPVPLNHTRK